MFGAIGALAVVLFIIAGSLAVPLDKVTRPDVVRKLTGPSAQNFFGTDTTGRDVFARIIYVGQISFTVAVLPLVIGVVVGCWLERRRDFLAAGWMPC